jgi:hypothetical protein
MVISSDKYEVKLISKSLFELRMVLVIKRFQPRDVGSYRCIAKNSLGEVESNIRLYGEFPRNSLMILNLVLITCLLILCAFVTILF